MKKILFILALLCGCASAQVVVGNGYVSYVTSAPSGSCGQNAQAQFVIPAGTLYTCQNGTWAQISGGGGGGGVSSVIIAGTANQISTSGTCTITSTGTCTLALPSTLVAPGTVSATEFLGTGVLQLISTFGSLPSTPGANNSEITFGTNGYPYFSANNGSFYQVQGESSTAAVTNALMKYDSNGNTTPSDFSEASAGVLTIGLQNSVAGAIRLFNASGTGALSVQTPAANLGGYTLTWPNTDNGTLAAITGSVTPGHGVQIQSDSLLGDCGSALCGAASTWNTIGSATAALTLSNSTYATTFNQTSPVAWTWANTTAATSSVSQPSPTINLCGTEWDTGPASGQGCMVEQFVPSNGLNAGGTFAFTHTGSGTGTYATTFPGSVASATSGGIGSALLLTQEGTVPSGLSTSAEDNCYADSTQHGILCNFNAGTTLPLVQGPASDTSGHVATWTGTNGGKLADGGALGTLATIATGTLTNGDYCTYSSTGPTIACNSTGGGGDTITSPNSTLNVGGTATNTTLDLAGSAGEIMAGATPALTYTPTFGKSGTAGTLSLFPASGNFTTTLGSAATASNTVNFFAAVPTTLHTFYCVTASTTCTLTDSGYAYNAIPYADLTISATNIGTTLNIAQYDVMASGGTAAAPVGIAPSSTSGAIFASAGSSANPAYDANATVSAGALSLGASGTLGSIALGNATSGVLTVEPATGAITSYTLQLPVAQPSGSNTFLSCTAANPAVCTWTAGGGAVTSVNNLTGAVVIEAATPGQMAVSGGNAAALTGAADMTYSTHTFATTTSGIFDWSAATGTAAFKVPSNSSNTATAAAVIDFDTTANLYHGFFNGGDHTFLYTSGPLGTPASGTLTNATGLPINGVVSATGAIATIADGNNPLTINCALTSGTTCLTTGETTAATTAGAVEHQITTLTTTTAIPLQITQGAAGPANAAAPNVINVSAAAAGGAAGASNAGSAGAGIGLLTGAGSAGGATTGIGGVGGSVAMTEGAGGNAGGTATNNGGNGGGVAWTTGAGGNGGTGAATAGSGGGLTWTLGAPGTNSATGTAGTVGQFLVTGNAPASTANAAGVAAGTIFKVNGVAGGASSNAAGTAGVGSIATINGGIGGAGTGTNTVGGAGGAVNMTAGNGGASLGTGVNANGGNIVLTGGSPGTGGSGTAGTTGITQAVTGLGTGAAPPACTPGSAGFWCAVEGTTFTNVSGAAGFYPDATAHEFKAYTNGASSGGLLVRAQPGAITATAQAAAITTATLCASVAGACNTAGEYHIHIALHQDGTACSANTTAGVAVQITWTDSDGTAHSAQTVPLETSASLTALSGTMAWPASGVTAYATGDFNIDTNGAIIQYATTYANCTTGGPAKYAINATVTRLQ